MDTNSDGPSKQAHSIDWVCEDSDLGRTFIYNEIKAGRLIARKAGRRTINLDSDYRAYLAALPTAGEADSRPLGDAIKPIARRLRSIHEATARSDSDDIPPPEGAAPEDDSS